MMLNKLDEAEETIKKVLEGTKSPKILVNAANIYFKKGDTAKAYIYFEKAKSIAPDSNYVKFGLGNFYIGIGKYKEGISLLEDLNYDTYASKFNLSKAYFQLGDYKTSIKYVKEAIKKKETISAYLLLAENYVALNDYTLASEAYSHVLKFDSSLKHRLKYAEYLFLSGDAVLSEKVLRDALNVFPKSIEIYELLYKILDFKGYRDKAFEVAKQAFEIVKTDRAFYLYAKDILYFNIKKINDLKNKIESKEKSPYLNLARVLYYIRLKNFDKSFAYIEKIDENLNKDIYIYKSFIYYKAREYNLAEKYAKLADKSNHSYLYLNFVLYWDKRKHVELKNLITEVKKLNINNTYRPEISFYIKPLVYDLDFSYRFDGSISSFINILLIPQIIEPNEMISFMSLGYKLINDNEELKALQELKKSIEFSEGIEFNNNGVDDFIKQKYKSAHKNIKKAEFKNDKPNITSIYISNKFLNR
jgi:tetratricopeptide (TPR) repeat protein